MKNFIIVDEIHKVKEKNIILTRSFSNALGLTNFPE